MHIKELLEILLSWVVFISPSYEKMDVPEHEYKPHSFFVEKVCGGKECNVLGWYNDQGIVYLDQDINERIHDELLLHEIVHYLQHKQGNFDTHSCEDSVKREFEAYRIQAQYSVAMGNLPLRMNTLISCKKHDDQETPD